MIYTKSTAFYNSFLYLITYKMNEFLAIYKETGESLWIYKINEKYYTINSKNKSKEYKKEELIFI